MKLPEKGSINFVTGECEENRISPRANQFRRFKNPWTGNKRKLLVDIYDTIDSESICFESMLDLFAGSGMVGLLGKTLGKRVITNDIMTFSYLFGKAFIENTDICLSKEEIDFLLKNKNKNAGSFVSENYSHRFTKNECDKLDHYYANVVEIFGSREECSIKFCLSLIHVLYYVMSRCFVGGRLNKGQVLADLEHRIKHSRNAGREMSFKNFILLNPTEFAGGEGHKACNEDAEKLLKSGKVDVDLAYIDPPYGGDQSDYIGMYRFFEEYIYQSQQLEHLDGGNKFISSDLYYNHFSSILKACSGIKYLVLSYNNDSWADIGGIKDCIDKHREKVIIKEVDYKYQYRASAKGKEYIIIAR